jgi:hypothetical protein
VFFIVSFDDCGMESPLQSRSAVSALALAQEAERNGCRNVIVQVPDGEVLPIRDFAARYGSPDAEPGFA